MWNMSGKQYREETSRRISWGHWFAFFNILWAIIVGARYAFLIDWPDTLFGKIYFFISLLGHFSFIVFAAYLLIVFPLSFLIKNHRTFRDLSVIIATLCATLLLFDTQVFANFNFHLSSVVWNLLINPENGDLSSNWQIFFAPMPLILLVEMLFSRWSWEKLRSLERQKWLKFVGLFFVCTFMATHLLYAWADAYLYRPITMQKSNFPLSYPMTARSFLEKHGIIDGEQYSQRLEQEGRPEALKLDYPKQTIRFGEVQKPANLVFISIAGLRHDAVEPNAMPSLSQFAEQSTYFTNHYSSGNDINAGVTGLFYGLSANYADSILQQKTPSILLKRLQQDNQYQLGLFSSNKFAASLFSRALLPKVKIDKQSTNNQNEINRFKNWLINAQQQARPYFGYLDLYIKEGLSPEAYVSQLVELDRLLGNLLPEIERENTLIIITAEQGYSFSHLNERARSNYFAREQIQVPMIVHWQDLPAGKVDKLTSHLDLLPAIMKHLFKVENPIRDYAQGRDLFDLKGSADWVLAGNYRWNVIITPEGEQYHIDTRGNYQEYDRDYQKVQSKRPPLGLFLEVFNQENSFMEK